MPCASFTGDFNGGESGSQVFQYKSETTYPGGIGLVVFDGPNAGYLWAGGIVPGLRSVRLAVQSLDRRGDLANLPDQRQRLGPVAAPSAAWRSSRTVRLVAGAGHTFWKLARQRRRNPRLAGTADHRHAGERPQLRRDGRRARRPGHPVDQVPDASGRLFDPDQQRDVRRARGRPRRRPKSNFVAADPTTLKNLDSIQIDQNVTARTVARQAQRARSTSTGTAPRAWSG